MLKIKPWCSTSSSNEMLLTQTSERACCSGAAPCVSNTSVLLHEKKVMSYVRGVSTPSQGFSKQHAEPLLPNALPPCPHGPSDGSCLVPHCCRGCSRVLPVVLLELRVVSSTARHLGKHFSVEGMLLTWKDIHLFLAVRGRRCSARAFSNRGECVSSLVARGSQSQSELPELPWSFWGKFTS